MWRLTEGERTSRTAFECSFLPFLQGAQNACAPSFWLVSLFSRHWRQCRQLPSSIRRSKNPQTHPRSILFLPTRVRQQGVESLLEHDSKSNWCLITCLTCYIYLHTNNQRMLDKHKPLVSRFPWLVQPHLPKRLVWGQAFCCIHPLFARVCYSVEFAHTLTLCGEI